MDKYAAQLEKSGISTVGDLKTRCIGSKTVSFNMGKTAEHGVFKTYWSMKWTRFCVLLAAEEGPDHEVFHQLKATKGKKTFLEYPFDHDCNGPKRIGNGAGGTECINGLFHGRLTDRAQNEARKQCNNGSRATCPGHGNPLRYCLFTGSDGRLLPCLNHEDHVPCCSHEPRCFP